MASSESTAVDGPRTTHQIAGEIGERSRIVLQRLRQLCERIDGPRPTVGSSNDRQGLGPAPASPDLRRDLNSAEGTLGDCLSMLVEIEALV